MIWLKNKLREWLEITDNKAQIDRLDFLYSDLVSIGIDVHFKEPHMILIYSHLKGGQIRHIPARFDSLKELNEFVKELKGRYKTEKVTWDMISPYQKEFL